MRAIIDTCEDVKLLVQREIIQQIELSDQVVEDLFNGMRKSIRPTNTLDLEKEIKKVNAKYDDSQKVNRAMVKYVYSAGKFYTVVLKTMFEVFPEALTLTTDLYEALLKVIDKEETKQLEKDMLLIGGNANCSPLESKAKATKTLKNQRKVANSSATDYMEGETCKVFHSHLSKQAKVHLEIPIMVA
ncbi:hypothetical protein JHK85_016265 [Glycine max]|nr:hypothetical protein JHK85_016265 [Glycine max]